MANELKIPRIMIAAPGSGSGKTLITCALLRILERRSLKAAAFKCGPDFIDPMFHKSVLGVPSRNLDLFLSGEEGVAKALRKGSFGRDIAVLEGVMGLYDGMSFYSEQNSSYDIARKTGTPVILVVNCAGMGRSVIPLIKGFSDYGKNIDGVSESEPSEFGNISRISRSCGSGDSGLIRGVILNNTSKMVFESLKDEIHKETGLDALGFLPKLKGIDISSRHLGLYLPDEIPDLSAKIDKVADALIESLDVDRLLAIAGYSGEEDQAGYSGAADQAKYSDAGNQAGSTDVPNKVKIGVALDEAFCFYYEDNLDLIREMGAEIVFFSPIHDMEIPEVSGIILGGGYPELYARELSENESMRRSIKEAADKGMPMLAECGGFLYLNRTLKAPGAEESTFEMAGVFEADAFMTQKLTHFGYVNVEAVEDTVYLKKGEVVRGHEFHYCDTTDNGSLCDIKKPSGRGCWKGYMEKNRVFAGFAHLYYPSAPELIQRFLFSEREEK